MLPVAFVRPHHCIEHHQQLGFLLHLCLCVPTDHGPATGCFFHAILSPMRQLFACLSKHLLRQVRRMHNRHAQSPSVCESLRMRRPLCVCDGGFAHGLRTAHAAVVLSTLRTKNRAAVCQYQARTSAEMTARTSTAPYTSKGAWVGYYCTPYMCTHVLCGMYTRRVCATMCSVPLSFEVGGGGTRGGTTWESSTPTQWHSVYLCTKSIYPCTIGNAETPSACCSCRVAIFWEGVRRRNFPKNRPLRPLP